jgi:ribose-phosphate pyrophosphokinase
MKKGLLVFSGGAHPALGNKVCKFLGLDPGKIEINRFPDGEIDMKILEDVRGADVYVIQPTCPPVNENLMELLIIIDCLRRASAERITAVIPYFGYARQDRKAEGRVPISAKLVANIITAAGATRALAVDLHAAQLQGFFDIPMDHLYAAPVLVEYFRQLNLKGPDDRLARRRRHQDGRAYAKAAQRRPGDRRQAPQRADRDRGHASSAKSKAGTSSSSTT